MKKFYFFIIFVFSACSGSIPYYVYNPNITLTPPGVIFPKSPIYILQIDGMSIFQIEKNYKMNKKGSCSQKKGFYLPTGVHSITIDGAPGPSGSKLSGAHTFNLKIKSGQKYMISYIQLRKLTRGKGKYRIVVINTTTNEVIASID